MQRADLESLEIAQQLLVILETNAHLRSDLGLARRTAEAGRQHADGLFDSAPLAAQFARAPIEGAQTVEDRAPDTELRVAAKLHLLFGIEFGKGVHQPDHARRDQILDVDVLRQPLMDAAREKTHDRQVLEQHALLLRGQCRRHPGRRIAARRSGAARGFGVSRCSAPVDSHRHSP